MKYRDIIKKEWFSVPLNKNIGFLGTGGIASAMARGIAVSPRFCGKIFLSVHKNRSRAHEIKELYPDKITITESNQELLDNSEIIFPAVLPNVLENIASKLKFKKTHKIIHIAAGTKISKAAPWYAPASVIVRAVPLPFSSMNMGPVVIYGDDADCEETISILGSPVKVHSERDLEILASVTGLMVPYYGLVGEILGWCMGKGLDFRSSADYVCCMNEALSAFMRNECTCDIDSFMKENTTPGGTNEMALRIIKEKNAYAPWSQALEEIGKRYGLQK